MKSSRKSCHPVLASRSLVLKQISCHLVLAPGCLVPTRVLLSGSLGFQSQHLVIRHGTIHTAQSTASHSTMCNHGHVCISSSAVEGVCAIVVSAAMAASAFKYVTWHTGIKRYIVQITCRGTKNHKSFAKESQAVAYLVRLTGKPKAHLRRKQH